jgi:hypothetical protein
MALLHKDGFSWYEKTMTTFTDITTAAMLTLVTAPKWA